MTQTEPAASDVEIAPVPPRRGWLRRSVFLLGLTCFAVLVYAVALIVTLPASAVRELVILPPQVTGLNGSAWQGRATLDGGYTLSWDLRGWSVLTTRAVTDWTLQGPDTQLTGILTVSPWAAEASDVAGRAGLGLLALLPGSPLKDCTSRAVVDVQTLAWQRDAARAGGVIQIDAGTCQDLLGRATAIPQMTLDLSAQGSDARAVLSDRDGTLAQVTVTGDQRLILRVEPEGATLVPGMPTGGPMIIEYPFATLF